MTKPVEPTLQTDEPRDNFKKKHLKWEKCLEVWERGNSTMFSHIYSAVCEFTRAYKPQVNFSVAGPPKKKGVPDVFRGFSDGFRMVSVYSYEIDGKIRNISEIKS
jgi:hypothetical protein